MQIFKHRLFHGIWPQGPSSAVAPCNCPLHPLSCATKPVPCLSCIFRSKFNSSVPAARQTVPQQRRENCSVSSTGNSCSKYALLLMTSNPNCSNTVEETEATWQVINEGAEARSYCASTGGWGTKPGRERVAPTTQFSWRVAHPAEQLLGKPCRLYSKQTTDRGKPRR